jgi:hypothetical protein
MSVGGRRTDELGSRSTISDAQQASIRPNADIAISRTIR